MNNLQYPPAVGISCITLCAKSWNLPMPEKFVDFDWKTDKTINDGCSKRRPDLLLDFGYQIVIIEIDENQHNNYDCSCENKRIMELSQDLGHRPIVFIRFNPDSNVSKVDIDDKLDKLIETMKESIDRI